MKPPFSHHKVHSLKGTEATRVSGKKSKRTDVRRPTDSFRPRDRYSHAKCVTHSTVLTTGHMHGMGKSKRRGWNGWGWGINAGVAAVALPSSFLMCIASWHLYVGWIRWNYLQGDPYLMVVPRSGPFRVSTESLYPMRGWPSTWMTRQRKTHFDV